MSRLDPRVWLLWGLALSLPAMLGRNPYALLAALIVAITVRSLAAPDPEWGKLLRLSVIFAVVGVIFNLATYHGGNHEIAAIPGWVPIVGGPLTLNALIYGVLSGLALVLLVTIWSTVAQQLDWSEVVRLLPPSLSGLALSGSIAFALIPHTIEAFGDVREAQAVRGFRPRGVRDLTPLVTPLLTIGLERAVTLSEALESRGYGGSTPAGGAPGSRSLGMVALLSALASGAFLVSTGRGIPGFVVLGAAAVVGVALARSRGNAGTTTRYREARFVRADRICLVVVLLAAIGTLVVNRVSAGALAYEPYPAISWPSASLPLIALIGALMIPAYFSAPAKGGAR